MKNDKKKLLVIGASILQLPAILKAKELGYYVGVVDYNPEAIGISYADEYFNVSTIDVEGVTKVAKNFHPIGIITLATDMPMRAVASACKACGLPGISYETAVKSTDKIEMIKAFEVYGVEHPWYYAVKNRTAFNEVLKKVTFPCIMKPTDNAGSRGVVLAHNIEELKENYAYSQGEARGGTVIIEEYLEGPEFSVEVMVVDGEPHVLQITDKLTTGEPHFVEIGHSQPTIQQSAVQDRIRNLAIRACKAIGINIGPVHVEMILTRNGPKMVELGARMGGDCITTHLVPLSTGIDMVAMAIKLACGEPIDIEPKLQKGSAIRYFTVNSGVIKYINGIEEAKKIQGVKEITIVHSVGDQIRKIENSTDRIGFVIAQADTVKEAVNICNTVLDKVQIVIE